MPAERTDSPKTPEDDVGCEAALWSVFSPSPCDRCLCLEISVSVELLHAAAAAAAAAAPVSGMLPQCGVAAVVVQEKE